MITRGHYIGQLVDELTSIAEQVKNRGILGLYDINQHCENFFREVLNLAYEWSLINLNEERSNFPGLDLGDKTAGVGVQVTSSKDSAKVNKTLEKALPEKEKFPTIYVFIIGEKQGSYTLKEEFTDPFKFSPGQILDIGDLLKKITGMRIDILRDLFEYVQREVVRVRIDLEIPDASGAYKTNISTYVEAVPMESFTGISSFVKSEQLSNPQYDFDETMLTADFRTLITKLKKLPRITRQFLVLMIERGDSQDGEGNFNLFDPYLRRICTWKDMDGELQLLEHENLVTFVEGFDDEMAKWRIRLKEAKTECFLTEIVKFLRDGKHSLDAPFVRLDFSAFS
jgi:hypothetical protein